MKADHREKKRFLLTVLAILTMALANYAGSIGIEFPENGHTQTPEGAATSRESKSSTHRAAPADPSAIEPITLLLEKSGSDIQFAWSGQSAPVSLTTSSMRTFEMYVETLCADSVGSGFTSSIPQSWLQYYDANDGTTASPADQGMGYIPRPTPRITSISPAEAWPCQSIDIYADGLDPIPSANRLEFNFQSIPATSVSPTSGTPILASFQIPPDARSTLLTLNVNGRTSPTQGAPWLAIRHPWAFDPFPNSSVAYAPATGKVWVSDTTGIWEVDMFTCPPQDPILRVSGGPYAMSRVTSDGFLLYVKMELGSPDIMQINTATPGVDPTRFSRTTCPGFHRDISPWVIGAHPDGSTAFIGDGQCHCLVKVPRDAGSQNAILDGWSGYDSPQPQSIDVAPDGTAIFGSGSAIYETPPQGGTSYLLFYTYQDRSIEFDRPACSPTTPSNHFVYDYIPNCEVFNIATRVGGRARIYDSSHIYLWPDTIYEIDPPFTQRVLLSNPVQDGMEFPYPSQYQMWDRVISMWVYGWPQVPLYLRVVDPPDAAPYASPPVPPEYDRGDNNIPPAETDWGLMTTYNGTPAKCISVTPPWPLGTPRTFFLKVPPNFSGVNFRIEMSKADWGGSCSLNNDRPYMSALYTSWKRVWVERDKMFRRGGVLYAPDELNMIIPAGTSTLQICKGPSGEQLDNLSVDDRIAIFDASTPFEKTHDEAYVGSIDRGASSDYTLVGLVTQKGGSDAYLSSASYTASPIDIASHYPDFSKGLSAGIGVVASADFQINDIFGNQMNGPGAAFYDADMRDIQQPFDDAFVEFIAPRSGMGALPFLPSAWFDAYSIDGTPIARFSQLWFAHKNPWAPPYSHWNYPQNYFHLIGASGASLANGLSSSDCDSSFILVNRIGTGCQPCTAAELTNHIKETTLHELTHQFRVNCCESLGHDSNYAWCANSIPPCDNPIHGPEYCIMHGFDSNSLDMRKDGIVRLDCDDLAAIGPVCGVPACSAGISVRTDTDPE